MIKAKILRTIFLHLVEDGLLGDEVLEEFSDEFESTARLRRQELELQLKQVEFERFKCIEETKQKEEETKQREEETKQREEETKQREAVLETVRIKQQMAEAQIRLKEKKLEAAATVSSKALNEVLV
ncbi:uncharacterized protein [Procambarus clarkii]|uniref:uncharacterized protein n=1 Tax=Procambarus clarkii TaxID=6728 RepID=UPI0037445361